MLQSSGQSSEFSDLWSAFSQSGNQVGYCQGWLDLQCARIPYAQSAVLLLRTDQADSKNFSAIGRWPNGDEPIPAILELAERVLDEQCGLVSELDDIATISDIQVSLFGVAYPLKVDQQIAGVVSVAIGAQADSALAYAMEQLQWGISWIELMVRRHQRSNLESDLPRLKSAVEILASVLADETFDQSCMTFVTELASALECERVSYGLMRLGRIKVKAISHSAEFGKQMNLVKMLESAMEEAVFQRSDITIPAGPDNSLVIHDHTLLADKHGCGAIYTLPLFQGERYTGSVTFERPRDRVFSHADLESARSITALCNEALLLKLKNDRPFIQKTAEFLYRHAKRLLGPGYLGRKLFIIMTALVAGFFYYATDTYRVAADVKLEGAIRQAVVAPFDGYIESADARAGDEVSKDQLLSRLDDRDLRLERMNWVSERAKLQRQYEESLAKHERAEAKVLAAQLEQNQANLDLVERQLDRTSLRAPFDGLVTSGDLSQLIGGTVRQGEVLFEVAPLDAYRLIMWVDEHQISDIGTGMQGHMVLKAMPDERFALEVSRITPITEQREGGNYFRVEALLKKTSLRLRPGMEGVAKIEVDERRLISILTQDLLRWLKIKAWAWMP
ncbi:MAG: efflux RND transporter periplasmic adaptor subunit [Candidatus Sedimenticola sp. 6PFRAG7]